jgi:hypothetical protein
MRDTSQMPTAMRYSRIIARAEHALAMSHGARAARAWARNELTCATAELRAAARHAEQAVRWLGDEPDAGLRTQVARPAGGEELSRGLSALAHALAEIGRHLGGAPD